LGVGWHWNKTEPFDRERYAAQLRLPLLVLHGERDDISPVADGEAIANAANGTLIRLPEGEHHGLWTTESTAITCYEAVRDFVTRVK
jgi:pimeloyl-ACP methyl ester carboxylesterase